MLENTVRETIPALIQRIVTSALVKGIVRGIPGLILGHAGVGKSSAFQQAADLLTQATGEPWGVVDVRVMLYDPVELKGIQAVDPDSDFARCLKPDWARGLDPDGNYLIVFEECTKALPSVQNALYQLILDRASGAFQFGKNWIPFATGNLSSSRSGDLPIPGALRDRFWIAIAETSAESWLDYASERNAHPYVTSFIKANPDCLETWDSEKDPLVFATPRSLMALSDACKVADNFASWGVPLLGQEAGTKFAAHCKTLDQLPEPESIFTDPENAPVMDDIGTAFYVGNMLAYWASSETMPALCTYAKRCPHEVAVAMVSETVKRHPECKETAAYIAFRCEYDPNQS